MDIEETTMEDERCCGTGTCLINDEGLCWCGQQWNGEVMCRPALPAADAARNTAEQSDPVE